MLGSALRVACILSFNLLNNHVQETKCIFWTEQRSHTSGRKTSKSGITIQCDISIGRINGSAFQEGKSTFLKS